MERNFKLSKKGPAQTMLIKTRLYSKVARYSNGFKTDLILSTTQDAFPVIPCLLHKHRRVCVSQAALCYQVGLYISYWQQGSLFVHIRNHRF